MSGQYQATLYLGDVKERVSILKNCGQSEYIVPLNVNRLLYRALSRGFMNMAFISICIFAGVFCAKQAKDIAQS